jgi:hypothetical protein
MSPSTKWSRGSRVHSRMRNYQRHDGSDGHYRKDSCSYLRRQRPSPATYLLHLPRDELVYVWWILIHLETAFEHECLPAYPKELLPE